MSTHFSALVRRTPVEVLRSHFEHRHPGAFAAVDWAAPPARLTAAIGEAIETLDGPDREALYAEIDRVGQFLNEHGRAALRSVLPAHDPLVDIFDAQPDVSACALLVLRHSGDLFDQALAAYYANRRFNGREWTGFTIAGEGAIRVREDSDEAFRRALQEILAGLGGRARRLSVERFTRRDPDPAGPGDLIRHQFTIYVEGDPASELAFEGEADLRPRIVRRVEAAAVIVDCGRRLLDVVARGRQTRTNIAKTFVETMLEPPQALAARTRRALALDLLKTRPHFALAPEDGVEMVEVLKLVLRAPDDGALASLEVRDRAPYRERGDLYDRAAAAFGTSGPLAHPRWQVVLAKLRVTFAPEPGSRRTKRVAFELRAPDNSNLREQLERHRQIADTLLARWGLYAEDA